MFNIRGAGINVNNLLVKNLSFSEPHLAGIMGLAAA
jgi:hypothetical protein